MARALAAALTVALVATGASLAACGGEEAGQDYAGFWRAADVALADCTLVKVWEDGDAYLVRVDYEAPRSATLGAGGLRVGAAGPATASPGAGAGDALESACELVLRRGTLVLVRAEAGASPLEVVLRPVAEVAYEQELASLSDDRVRMEVMALASAVYAWAERHGGRPPAVPLFGPDSEFARSLDTLGAGWPTNPFTAEPMHSGDGPGDFAYSTAGSDFELIGYLSDGEAYAAE
ncbi:MAG: hypothetical protein EHM52_00750 [Actinomycetota bacterium]|nr:MAG: hypothetical protein EHM52_00750 [Actinomycetota bacterium]